MGLRGSEHMPPLSCLTGGWDGGWNAEGACLQLTAGANGARRVAKAQINQILRERMQELSAPSTHAGSGASRVFVLPKRFSGTTSHACASMERRTCALNSQSDTARLWALDVRTSARLTNGGDDQRASSASADRTATASAPILTRSLPRRQAQREAGVNAHAACACHVPSAAPSKGPICV